LARNKSSEQEQDPSFHKGPMPLWGVKGHTTTITSTFFTIVVFVITGLETIFCKWLFIIISTKCNFPSFGGILITAVKVKTN
jgi:hypothetical protein